MKRCISKFLKILGLVGGLFLLIFGNLGNFLRTVRLVGERKDFE